MEVHINSFPIKTASKSLQVIKHENISAFGFKNIEL